MSALAEMDRHDRRNEALCTLAALFFVLATLPFVEAGFNDDWIYSHMALSLARTGHFRYESAVNATVLIQTYLGSFLIRHLGFSFQLLRFTTLPFAASCGFLCYRLGRMSGLGSLASLFGALATVSSPLFVPHAASFMSDVWACFFSLLSIYAGVRALNRSSSAAGVAWLAGSVVAGFAAGLERQSGYLTPATLLLWVLWQWRGERLMFGCAAGLFLLLCAASYLVVRWQTSLPISEDDVRVYTADLWKIPLYPGRFVLTLAALLLPAMIPAGKESFRLRPYSYAAAATLVAVGFAGFAIAARKPLFPWEGNILTPTGIIGGGVGIGGDAPETLIRPVRLLFTVAVLAALIFTGAAVMDQWKKQEHKIHRTGVPATIPVFLLYLAANFAFLLYRSPNWTFDRYLLPLMPVALILVLFGREKCGLETAKPANWVALTVFAYYGVASTHDYLASLQTRVNLYRQMEASGLPARTISGGMELDGWTQSEITSGRLSAPPRKEKQDPAQWSPAVFPDIKPRYYLAWSVEKGVRLAPFGGGGFTAWLPPFHRDLFVVTPDVR